MKKLNKLKKILQVHKAALKDEFGVIEIGLFGSYTKGNQKEDRDKISSYSLFSRRFEEWS